MQQGTQLILIVYLVINRNSDQSFAITLPQVHLLRDLIVLDNRFSTYIINRLEYPVDVYLADLIDIVLVGNIALYITYQGKQIILNILDRPNRKNTWDLVLHNIALVPEFYTNLISRSMLKDLGYQLYTLNNTLQYMMLLNSIVIIRMTLIYRLIVAQYKRIDTCFTLPQAPLCIFSMI